MLRSTSLKIMAGIAGITATAGIGVGFYYADQNYISGPKHGTRFKTQGIPTQHQYVKDQYHDYRFIDQTDQFVAAFSLWRPNARLEPNGYNAFNINSSELMRATEFNLEQLSSNSAGELELSVCTIWGFGRVGYKSNFHEFLIEGILQYTPEYDQQIRLNIDKVECQNSMIHVSTQNFTTSQDGSFQPELFSDESRLQYPGFLVTIE